MKRPASSQAKTPNAKRLRQEIPDYHRTPTVKESDGSVQWPAPRAQIENARDVILRCAQAKAKTLIVPDKDVDGLASGTILRQTLLALGLPEDKISAHFLHKGNTIHCDEERAAMVSHEPRFVFVLDQGSRSAPPVIDGPHEALIIDHHYATDNSFPESSHHITACHSPPVAPSSLLTYTICSPLDPTLASSTAWLCIIGTQGDLGSTLKWAPPLPDMSVVFKQHSKKLLIELVALLNAPRRAAQFQPQHAWDALQRACSPASTLSGDDDKKKRPPEPGPQSILSEPLLHRARAEVNAEIERCTHAAPTFSADGQVAVLRISSAAQVHPVIATRWAAHLRSARLEIVLVANQGYLPGRVNFSCRVARCARVRSAAGDGDGEVDIIAALRGYAGLDPGKGEDGRKPLLERLGDDFARGHVQASGGIVGSEEFEELMRLMRVGETSAAKKDEEGEKKKKKTSRNSKKGKRDSVIDPGQKTTLMGYFGKGKSLHTSEAKS